MSTGPTPEPSAYQAWHCSYCERTAGGSGSVVMDSAAAGATPMYCEVCGTGYDHDGRYVPDPDDAYTAETAGASR